MSKAYPKFLEQALLAGLGGSLESVDIKAVLIDTGTYTYNAAHTHLDDLTGIVATSPTLTGVSVTLSGANVTVDAANTTFTSVTGDTVEAVAYYIDTGVASTSLLISFVDGLTLTPDGNNVNLTVDDILSFAT